MVLGAAKAFQCTRTSKALKELPLDDDTRFFLGMTGMAFLMGLFLVGLSGAAIITLIWFP